MRIVSALVLVAGLATCAYAQDGTATQPADAAKTAEAAKQAADAAAEKAKQDAAAAAKAAEFAQQELAKVKKAIPVPDNAPVATSTVEGILIEELKLGEGYEVKPGGAVVALYHGTLKADPTKVFDSAFERGEPIAFPLSGVIEGWQKGVPGMKIGGVRRLTIPAAMAYGANSPSPDIPANSDLVFVIQLVDAVQSTDTVVGTGDVVAGQCVPVTNYVIKDGEGKVVGQNPAGQPYVWFPGEFEGLTAGLEGMKVGGKRTIKVPKGFNEAMPGVELNRPTGVDLTIEVELIANRNLPQNPRGRR
ncbi:MAG TPA: FKBP-type peptidyl-prolyl cis-trans isomerase [Phycisphaerales bacterium]|nr:FKBP-type peptidyl-prolyl cis-trans isomerase [Phycisphaerales bacterium]